MTDRASIQITASKRAPPKRRHIPDRPVDGYHVTTAEPTISDLSSENHVEEIARAIAEIEELDEMMLTLDETIVIYQNQLSDPLADPWDLLAIERAIEPLLEERHIARYQVIQCAGEIATHGAYLIGDWKDYELDWIGREMTQGEGVLARVFEECPGIETHPVWSRLEVAACPF